MDTALALTNTEPVKYKYIDNLTRKGLGRPKGAKNKRTRLLESYIIPQAIKTLESIPKSIRDQYKEALSYKGLVKMDECLDKVESTEKPIITFNAAARLYDLTAPKVQQIDVKSTSTTIRSQDMLEALKLMNVQGDKDSIDITPGEGSL